METVADELIAVSAFGVALMYEDECISRYDTAHKEAHRDVLGKKRALIKKEWHGSLTLNEVFENALEEYKQNYRSYLDFFLSH